MPSTSINREPVVFRLTRRSLHKLEDLHSIVPRSTPEQKQQYKHKSHFAPSMQPPQWSLDSPILAESTSRDSSQSTSHHMSNYSLTHGPYTTPAAAQRTISKFLENRIKSQAAFDQQRSKSLIKSHHCSSNISSDGLHVFPMDSKYRNSSRPYLSTTSSAANYGLTRTRSEMVPGSGGRRSRSDGKSSFMLTTKSARAGNLLGSNEAISSPITRRHRSLTGLRTYYAFGAKSQRETGHGPITTSSNIRDFDYSTSQLKVSTSYGLDNKSTFVPSVNKQSLALISSRCQKLAISPSSSSSAVEMTTIRTSDVASKLASPVISYRAPSPVAPAVTTVAGAMGGVKAARPKSSYSSRNLEIDNHLRNSERTKSETLLPTVCTSPVAKSLKGHDVPAVTSQSRRASVRRSEIELRNYEDRNKTLQKEIDDLKKQLRDRDRIEMELRRKLLESEAETRVWRGKYDQMRRANQGAADVRRESIESPPEVSDELFTQLDKATKRLSEFDVLGDMEKLQSEMEVALKEITERPVKS